MLKKRLNFRELLKDTEEAKSGLNCYLKNTIAPVGCSAVAWSEKPFSRLPLQ